MLHDGNRAKVAEHPQDQKEKTRINEIASLSVNKFAARQLEQGGRQISPDVEISDRFQRQRKSPPRGPNKDYRYRQPIDVFADRSADCQRLDHFSNAAASSPSSAQRA